MHLHRLENLRIDRDQTQQEIANYLHCRREVYRRYEKGTRTIPIDYLIQLAHHYNTSVDYILELTDELSAYPCSKSKG